MEQQTILLLGGAGFIGSHIAESYIANGHKVIVLDDFSSGSIENLVAIQAHPNFTIYEGSILDTELLEKIFTDHQIAVVNNHAAQKSVPASVIDPLHDNELNIVGVLNLLAVIKNHPIQRFIQASSGGALAKEIIGNVWSKETDMPLFTSPYALTKFAVEQYLTIYGDIYGFEYILLRYANVYGPRQVADGECGVVPIFVDNILANRPSKLMTYEDMPRGCTRDYIYVGDVAEFNQLLIDRKTWQSGVYNIGSGVELAMMDIYEALLAGFNCDVAISIAPPRVGDLKRSILDATKLKQNFNWQPHTSLTGGIEALRTYYNNK